ncbi:MAG: hypothetical protein NT062_18045, partial [Proteobacteria bacterium]|nr:hypothetical protein [Pseudomonadota bacterium]
GDLAAREAALLDARALCELAMKHTANVRWIGYLAEIDAGLADLATARGDVKGARAAWTLVRDLLEPLAKDGRLSWTRKPLLERARATK